MYAQLLTGIGAGLASALLFAVVISGSPAAMLLSYLTPLPIFIVTIGWRHGAGLAAALTGAIVCGLIFGFGGGFSLKAGLAYGLGLALPAWWIGYLAMLGRTDAAGRAEWYPLGNILLWLAGIATLVALLGAIAVGGGYAAYEQAMRGAFGALFDASQGSPALPDGVTRDDLIDTLITTAPLLTAGSFAPMLTLNLWLAGRIVAASGRLARPWPAVAATRMPFWAVGALAVAILLATLGQGYAGFTGLALTGALGAAFALQCLAALHTALRGKPARPFILALLYALLIPFFVWILPVLALGGVLDSLARAFRKAGAAPPPANDA